MTVMGWPNSVSPGPNSSSGLKTSSSRRESVEWRVLMDPASREPMVLVEAWVETLRSAVVCIVVCVLVEDDGVECWT
jgi:hypothetical protein